MWKNELTLSEQQQQQEQERSSRRWQRNVAQQCCSALWLFGAFMNSKLRSKQAQLKDFLKGKSAHVLYRLIGKKIFATVRMRNLN